MKITQILLLLFAFLYSLGVKCRTWMYKMGYWGKVSFSVPIISVGNLQAGGTGKTPMVDYLCEILSSEHQVGVLSRGYKRLTYGFRIVQEKDTYKDVGDEPSWLKRRHPQVTVGVAENRIEGIPHLISNALDTEVVILDDGFQQLGIRMDINILMTPYHRPYSMDMFLPSGRLREAVGAAKRADIIIVTKCPESVLYKKEEVLSQLNIKPELHQQVFLSALYYAQPYALYYEGIVKSLQSDESILLVTGIGDAAPLYEYVRTKVKTVKHLSFPDHYRYRSSDLQSISDEFLKLNRQNPARILTTEKDAVRFYQFRDEISALSLDFYIQPMLLKWDDEKGLRDAVTKIF